MTRQNSCRPCWPRSSAINPLIFAGPLFPRVLIGGFLVLCLLFAAGLSRLLHSLVYTADEVERLLGQFVVLAFDDLLEGANRLVELDELAFETCELLGNEERLGEEALEPPGPTDYDLVLLRELVYA